MVPKFEIMNKDRIEAKRANRIFNLNDLMSSSLKSQSFLYSRIKKNGQSICYGKRKILNKY